MFEPFLSLLQGLRLASQRLLTVLVWSATWLAGRSTSWQGAGARRPIDNPGKVPGPGCSYRQSSTGARAIARDQRHASMTFMLAGVAVDGCGWECKAGREADGIDRLRAIGVGSVRSGFFVERGNGEDDGGALGEAGGRARGKSGSGRKGATCLYGRKRGVRGDHLFQVDW